MGTIVIGLVGPAGAGKSSVAGYLEERYGARRYSFAQPLKEMLRAGLGLSEDQVYGTQAQKEAIDTRYGVSARKIMQGVGTDGIGQELWQSFGPDVQARCIAAAQAAGFDDELEHIPQAYVDGFRVVFGRDCWCQRLMERIVRERAPVAVVEDVRFVNEARAIRGYAYPAPDRAVGWVWRLWPVGESTSTDAGTHASEREWQTAGIASHEIRPVARGLAELFEHVRGAAAACNVRPAVSL